MSQTNPTRRGVLVAGASAAAVATIGSSANAGDIATGVVFGRVIDADFSRVDAGRSGNGIPGVLVSNGIEVVASDAHGNWALPFRAGAFVFPIRPRDWSIQTQSNRLPFTGYRLDAKANIEPINFEMTRSRDPRRFSVALVADTQPQTSLELGYFRDSILPTITGSGAAFAINHGDIVFDNHALYERYVGLIGATGIPWYHCPGNHDMNGTDATTRFEAYKAALGPTTFAFQYGRATFIVLNNVTPLPNGRLTSSGNDYIGRVGPDQLLFTKRLLAELPKDDLVVVSFHIPLVGFDDPADVSGQTDDARELMRLLSGRPNTLSLAGHTHTTEHHYLGTDMGFVGPGLHHHIVLTAACGSWWSGPFDASGAPVSLSRDGTPKGFHLLDVDGTNYSTRFVPVGTAGDSKMSAAIVAQEEPSHTLAEDGLRAVVSGRCISCSQLGGGRLLVNVYDGGPRTKVACRITGSQAGVDQDVVIGLVRTIEIDATAATLFAAHQSSIKPWVVATPSSHLWAGEMPRGIGAGIYSARIDIRDEYGCPNSSTFIFEVTA